MVGGERRRGKYMYVNVWRKERGWEIVYTEIVYIHIQVSSSQIFFGGCGLMLEAVVRLGVFLDLHFLKYAEKDFTVFSPPINKLRNACDTASKTKPTRATYFCCRRGRESQSNRITINQYHGLSSLHLS